MFPPENLDVNAAVRICFLNSLDFVKLKCLCGNTLNVSSIFESMKEVTGLRLYNEAPFLTERQRAEAIRCFYKADVSYPELFRDAIEVISSKFLHLSSGHMEFRSRAALDWVECYSTRISTVPLLAQRLADTMLEGRNFSANIVRSTFLDPLIPLPDDIFFKEHLEKGFSEVHLHYANSAHPFYVLNQAIQAPADWIRSFDKDKQQRKIWQYLLPNVTANEMAVWLRMAKIIREWLVCWINCESDQEYLFDLAVSIESNCVNPEWYFRNLSTRLIYEKHPGECLANFYKTDTTLVLEGALWTRTLLKLRKNPTVYAVRMLHLYHLLSTIVFKLSVHQNFFTGFDLFESLAQSPLRDSTENAIHNDNLQQIILSGGLRKLELRVSGKEEQDQFVNNKLSPPIKAFEAFLKRFQKPNINPAKEDDNIYPTIQPAPGTLQNTPQLGVVCHFIKKTDELRKKISSAKGWRYTTTPRHVELRHSLIAQLEVFLKTRREHPYGKYLVGIDGAGSEFSTPPEVFAPIFRQLKYQMELESSSSPQHSAFVRCGELPKLHYTFHVGEDFYHILSGIRAVVEAIKFLKLPRGSRLGHCVALGLKPEWWLEKNTQVKMPRLQRLDDLVWFLKFVDDHKTRTDIYAKINKLSTDIYGRPHSHHSLLRAWRWRYLGFSEFEKMIPSQKQLRRKLRTKGYLDEDDEIQNPEVREIMNAYHFDMKCYRQGEEIITVNHSAETCQAIVVAIEQAQEYVKKLLSKKQIAIETCPSSNLRISQMDTLDDHPIFQWHPAGNYVENGVYPLIATDNPGYCQTSIPLEFCAIKQAAIRKSQKQDKELSPKQLQAWIDAIMKDTNTFSFLP